MERVDCVVVGAGVIGLAVARALACEGREVLILEAESAIGTATSSRNSEVIHAGIYYPTDSLKARLCIAGRDMLYRFCDDHGVAYRRCGKLIVAADAAQTRDLDRLWRLAQANGVNDLQRLDQTGLSTLEREIAGVAALLSPSTGIVDSHALMLSLLGEAEVGGAVLALRSPVEGVNVLPHAMDIQVGTDPATTLRTSTLVNAAGHGAIPLASRIHGLPAESVPRSYLAKGSYFSLAHSSTFGHLVYPLPGADGLGIHLTLDLAGRARFGPDVQWVDALDYDLDPTRVMGFYPAIRRYWPSLKDDTLLPAYAGIRPRLGAPGAPAVDFRIDGPSFHGVPGLVNLFGIESPGLTACLAIAGHVSSLLS